MSRASPGIDYHPGSVLTDLGPEKRPPWGKAPTLPAGKIYPRVKSSPGKLVSGKLAPGKLVPGKLVPGKLVPGKVVPGKVVRVK